MPSTEITIHAHEGEPRVLDTDLAAKLGYAEPRMIRKLIKRHEAAMATMGAIRSTVSQNDDERGRGRPGTEYHLNRAQALFIITKAETTKAVEVTVAVIEKFLAYEAGLIQPPRPALPDFSNPVLAARAWADEVEQKQLALVAKEAAEAQQVALEATVAEMRPMETLGRMVASRQMALPDVLRTLYGVNLRQAQNALVDLGIFRRTRHKKLRVNRGHWADYYLESPEDQWGGVVITVTAKGRAHLASLYRQGKLPMRAGCKPQSILKAVS